jgi:hypothetical protein
MIWLLWAFLAALILVGVVFACALARVFQRADAEHAIADCDHPACGRSATVRLDINGQLRCSCEQHVGDVVRKASDSSFEALGVSA